MFKRMGMGLVLAVLALAPALPGGVLAAPADASPVCLECPTMHVARIDLAYRWIPRDGYLVTIGVVIRDQRGRPVPGAEVDLEVKPPLVPAYHLRLKTDLYGTLSATGHTLLPGTYVVTVKGVSKHGWAYDLKANAETMDQIRLLPVVPCAACCVPRLAASAANVPMSHSRPCPAVASVGAD